MRYQKRFRGNFIRIRFMTFFSSRELARH